MAADNLHVLETSVPPDRTTEPKMAADNFHVLETSVPPDKTTEACFEVVGSAES